MQERMMKRRAMLKVHFGGSLLLAMVAIGLAAVPIVSGQVNRSSAALRPASLGTQISANSLQSAGEQTAAPRPKFGAFEVATIKPVTSSATASRYIMMQGTSRFVEKDYTLKLLIAAAYNLNPKAVAGGPGWVESDHYDIEAVTPGHIRPSHDEQMGMLRSLLADRFGLTFHREQKEFSIYALEVAKNGPKLKASTLGADEPSTVGPGVVYPQRIVLPARNATMDDFASLLQRAILDRPVVDRTGLSGRYDFDLEWAPDESQFGGDVPAAPADAPSAPLFVAVQQELGLKLIPHKGPVSIIVIDRVDRPSPN